MEEISILYPAGASRRTADFSDCMSDLELTRLCTLLLPFMSVDEGVKYAQGLVTCERETIAFRNDVVFELLDRPELTEAIEQAAQYIKDIRFYSEGVRENVKGLTAGDAVFDGLKGFIDGLEKLLSKNSAAVFDDNEPNNYYAQFVRATVFTYENLRAYSRAMALLKNALSGFEPSSQGLKTLKSWVEAAYLSDKIGETAQKLAEIEKWWQGLEGFGVDVCVTPNMDVESLEMNETRSAKYSPVGMLDKGAEEGYDGLTSLISFPQGGISTLFQEYLLSELGISASKQLGRLRGEVTRLPMEGRRQLVAFGEELPFYSAAARMAQRLRDKGMPVCRAEMSGDCIIDAEGVYMTELALSSGSGAVANDMRLPAGGTIDLITGANSSGKTTYIITAGQLQWLFQLGCCLPCRQARMRPVEAVFTLFASGESDTAEDSRMGLEVIRIGSIKERMTSGSMILMNEPMTSTSAAEGIEICIDLLCDLISSGVSGMLVTHYNEIYAMAGDRLDQLGARDRLKSYVMAIERGRDGSVSYTYKLTEALPGKSSYAYAVVSRLGVTLEAMLLKMSGGGMDVRPDAPEWSQLHGEVG